MAFDISTAKPIQQSSFDISTAKPLEAQNGSVGRINSDVIDNVSPGIDQSLIQKVDKVLFEIPGVPSLAEFSAGLGRSVAGVLDFFGPDTVNAILEVVGTDQKPGAEPVFKNNQFLEDVRTNKLRVPTFSQLTEKPGTFVEPGLQQQVLSTAGEIAPVALGIGQVLRTLASKLPGFAATESAGAGTVRQLGQTTATQDFIGGAAAGAGQEVGRELDGETGALIGGVAAPIALAVIPLNAARNAATKLLSKAAPKPETLKDTASTIYKSLDESGVSVSANKFDVLADDITRTLKTEGSDKDLTQKAVAVVNRLLTEKGTPKTLQELDTLRKVAKGAADSIDRADSRLGVIAVNKIDEFLDGLGAEIAPGTDAGKAFRSARDLWQRVRKTETLEQALTNAQNQASGFENGIRTQFRQILKKIDTGKLKGYTDEEKAAIRKVVQGTNAGNVAKFLGKFGVLDGVTSRSLTTISGTGLVGAATGNPLAAAAVPLIGQVSGALAQRMTLNNAKMAQSIIRAGKNGKFITDIYIKNTPKAQQSASELAELFIKNKVPLEGINLRTVKPLISDAAVIASIAKFNDSKEGDQ